MPINVGVMLAQILGNLHTFILWQPYWWVEECPINPFSVSASQIYHEQNEHSL